MKTYPHLFAKLFASPLLLRTPERIAFEQVMEAHMLSSNSSNDRIGTPVAPDQATVEFFKEWDATKDQLRIEGIYTKLGNVAVVKIHGAIDKVLTQFEMDCYGGCDLADVDRALSLAGSDPKIDTIILDIHSPGGSVTGTPETAARVARLRETKEVHAYTATMCCSAAYYIASQADRIVSAPSACVGSIGVYMAIIDQTRQLENEGIAVELIKAGRLKAMGASFKKLTDEERDLLQASVDKIHKEFKAAVTTLRKVKDEDMQGQWFDGTEAHTKGLVDEITELSIDEYAASLLLAR